jgi:hypothetical protein
VTPDVIGIVLWDEEFWSHLRQLVKVIKPIVDAIRNIKAHDTGLADCMLELIQCAQDMIHIL